MGWRWRRLLHLALLFCLLQVGAGRDLGVETWSVIVMKSDRMSHQRDIGSTFSNREAKAPRKLRKEEIGGGEVEIPVLIGAKAKKQKDLRVLMVKGSGFNDSETLACRMAGFETVGNMSQEAKVKAKIVAAQFVSEELVKCPYSTELQKMMEIIIEVSNDGEHFSIPLVYHPQHPVPGTASNSSTTTPKAKGNNEGTAQSESSSANGKDKEAGDSKPVFGANQPGAGKGKKESSPFGANENTKGNDGRGLRPPKPLQSTMDMFRRQPHLGGILLGLTGLITFGILYRFCGHRTATLRANGVDRNVAYTRVQASEGDAIAVENANGANGNTNAFGLYDDDEETAAGWEDWDNDWDKDEELGQQNTLVTTEKETEEGN